MAKKTKFQAEKGRERITAPGARGTMDATLRLNARDPEALPMARTPKLAPKGRKGKR